MSSYTRPERNKPGGLRSEQMQGLVEAGSSSSPLTTSDQYNTVGQSSKHSMQRSLCLAAVICLANTVMVRSCCIHGRGQYKHLHVNPVMRHTR